MTTLLPEPRIITNLREPFLVQVSVPAQHGGHRWRTVEQKHDREVAARRRARVAASESAACVRLVSVADGRWNELPIVDHRCKAHPSKKTRRSR